MPRDRQSCSSPRVAMIQARLLLSRWESLPASIQAEIYHMAMWPDDLPPPRHWTEAKPHCQQPLIIG